MRFRHLIFAAAIGLTMAGFEREAPAFVWPSVPDRMDRALSEGSVVERRLAAERLTELSPKQAEPLVLKALDDSDLDVRLRAGRAAADLGLLSASEKVIAWLGDAEARLRLAACELLVRAPSPKAAQALGRALSDPDASVRLAAATALGELEVEESVSPLLGRLEDASPPVRVEVVRALSRIGDARAAFALSAKLGDSASEVRREAARALGELRDPRTSSALVLALRDRDPSVRVQALDALGKLGADDAALSIAPLLSEKRAPEVRKAALAALGRLGSERAIDALIQALDADDPTLASSPVREALVLAGARAKAPLLSALASSSARGAASAALALSNLRSEGVAEAILEAMRRGSVAPELGLRALATCGDPVALPAALELLSHSRAAVRGKAIETSIALLDPAQPDGRAIEPLTEALHAPHASLDERAGLIRALGRTASPRAVPVLGPYVHSKEPQLRVAAVEALGALGPAGQDAFLIEALDDAVANVRLKAALALASSASEATSWLLLERTSTTAERDRGALGIAISGAMARAREGKTIARVADILESSGGELRDALIEGLGRLPGAAASDVIAAVARSASPDDRRKAAEALAGHPEALSTLMTLLDDPEPSVRKAAVWSLGAVHVTAPTALVDHALARLGDADGEVVANAVAAAAKLAKREGAAARELAGGALCRALEHRHAHVRANALAGLALLERRCGDDGREREILRRDPHDVVRSAAAGLLHRVPGGHADLDRRALSRCLLAEKSVTVAQSCRAPEGHIHEPGTSKLLFVMPEPAAETAPQAPFALRFSDGFVRLGLADRRGAVFELLPPRGPLTWIAQVR